MDDDSTVIKKVLKGETRYFSELVEKYETRVYKTCYRFTRNEQDALDLCQEVFIKIFDNLENFAGASSLSTWIYKISVNTCLNFLRTKDRLVLVDGNHPGNYHGEMPGLNGTGHPAQASIYIYESPEDYMEVKEILELLDLNLEKVGARNRKIFKYRLLHGMPFKEIAEKLGIRPETARMNYSRTRKLVKQSLQEYKNKE